MGGAGYVGSELCAELLRRGHDVLIDDLLIYGEGALESLRAEFEKVSFSETDISGHNYGREHHRWGYGKIDVCVNLAGFSNDPVAQAYPALNWKWNVYGAAKVAALCQSLSVPRLIYASSASVYHTEDFAADVELGEGAPVRPHFHYSISKYCGEEASGSFHEQGKLDVVVVRKGTVCGVSRRQRFDLMLNAMFAAAIGTKVITVDGSGGVYRPVLDIDDAVSAYVALIEADPRFVSAHRPEVFNVVTENDKVMNFAKRTSAVLIRRGIDHLVATGAPRLIQRSYRVSSRKLEERLGWTPKGSCESIAGDLCDEHFAKKLPAFDDVNCHNIKALEGRTDLR